MLSFVRNFGENLIKILPSLVIELRFFKIFSSLKRFSPIPTRSELADSNVDNSNQLVLSGIKK